MITLKLLHNTDDVVTYRYFIEGKKNSFGDVVVTKSDLSFIFKPKDSEQNESYRNTAVRSVGQYVRDNDYPTQDTIGWY